MKQITAFLLLGLCLCQETAYARDKCAEAACAEVREKIYNIESRMRAGYTRAQGERYAEQLRVLRAKRYKLCR